MMMIHVQPQRRIQEMHVMQRCASIWDFPSSLCRSYLNLGMSEREREGKNPLFSFNILYIQRCLLQLSVAIAVSFHLLLLKDLSIKGPRDDNRINATCTCLHACYLWCNIIVSILYLISVNENKPSLALLRITHKD